MPVEAFCAAEFSGTAKGQHLIAVPIRFVAIVKYGLDPRVVARVAMVNAA
jgi:hypothetical protein